MLGAFRKFIGLGPPQDRASGGAAATAAVADSAAVQRLRLEGNAHLGEGRIDEAATCYARATQLDPHDAASHLNLGYARLEQGQPAPALESLARAAALDSASADAPYLMGRAHRELGRLPEAIAHLERALALNPALSHARADLVAIHLESARQLHAAQSLDEALQACDRALALEPDQATTLHGRAVVLVDQRRFAEALQCMDQALAAGAPPDGAARAALLQTRAIALEGACRHEEAHAAARSAVDADPSDAEGWRLLAATLLSLGRHGDALAIYEEAFALHPEHAHLRWDEALCRLLTGDFDKGWKRHEWRLRSATYSVVDAATRSTAPRWDASASLAGRRILVHAEQGLGDAIQFVRYVPLLLERGADVLVQVPQVLVRLMRGLVTPSPAGGKFTVIGSDDDVPLHDLRCSLLSLPAAFGTAADSIPADVPYLAADAALRESWRARLLAQEEPGRPRRLRAGLVWSGNPRHHNDHNRSIPLAQLAKALPTSIDWIALQPSASEADRRSMTQVPGLRDLGAALGDFADTAALIENLDLVVTVDTSVAHLAGALGRPVWVLLPHNPDWRWLLGRDDSPWYPTCRLFRQDAPGRWDDAIGRLRQALLDRSAGG
ncbi:MAG: tetratricopeptide repeat protein [Ramlibacter sp.]|nr:tetratricopeptide repeat protein [Ramlibacter sp.]